MKQFLKEGCVGLLLVGIFTICGHFLLKNEVYLEEKFFNLVHLMESQSMLAQKVAVTASTLANPLSEEVFRTHQARLNADLTRLMDQHKILVLNKKKSKLSPERTIAIRDVFYSSPYNLDKQLRTFSKHAQALTQLSPEQMTWDNPDLQAMLKQTSGDLFTALEKGATTYKEVAIAKTKINNRVEWIVLIISWLLMFLSAFTILKHKAE